MADIGFGWEGWYTIGVLILMFIVLVRDWAPADLTLVGTLGLLMAGQVITTSEGLEGFSSSAVLSVAVLYVVAAGINSTGALDHIFGKVLGNPKSLALAQIRLMIPIAIASAFLNNTPLCAIMIPLIQRWARKIRQPVSQLMIPLSFASILGGTITLIGTSTNLVISGKFETQFPDSSIGLFDVGIVGVPAAMTGIIYIIMFAPMLLPGFEELERRSRRALGLDDSAGKNDNGDGEDGGTPSVPAGIGRDFTVACIVTQYSPVIGKAVDEAGLRGLNGLYLTSVQRGQRMHNAVGPEFVINENDVLFFTGLVDQFGEFCFTNGFELLTDANEDRHMQGEDYDSDGEHSVASTARFQHGGYDPIGWDGGANSASVATVKEPNSPAKHHMERRNTFEQRIIKVIVRSGSHLEGKTAKEMKFRKVYDAAILSLYRAGSEVSIRGNLGRIPLEVGDVLLIVTGNDFDWNRPEIARDIKPYISEEVVMEQARDGSRIGTAIDQLNNASQIDLEREFLIPMRVSETTQLRGARSLVGQTVESAGLRGLPGLFLVAVEHENGGLEHVAGPELVLEANDMLWFAGERDAVSTLRRIPGLSSPDTQAEKLKVQPVQRRLVECVVSMRSHLIGKTVREAKFRTLYEAAIIAVHRQGRRVLSKIGDIELRAGDVLILDTGPTFVQRYRDNPNFLLVTEINDSAPPHFDKFYIAITATIIMLVLYVVFSDYLSLVTLAIFVSAVMLLTGILTPEAARASVSWDVIVTVASAFGLSNALSGTGVATVIGNGLVDLASLMHTGYPGVLTAVYLATFLLSMVLSNNSAAVLMFDIAITAAQNSCADGDDGDSTCVKQMIYTLMLAASSSFSTSYGYQTNMMVLNVGNYVFMDFLRFGFPMQIWQMVTSLVFIYFMDYYYLVLPLTFGAFVLTIFVRVYLTASLARRFLPGWCFCCSSPPQPLDEDEDGSSKEAASSTLEEEEENGHNQILAELEAPAPAPEHDNWKHDENPASYSIDISTPPSALAPPPASKPQRRTADRLSEGWAYGGDFRGSQAVNIEMVDQTSDSSPLSGTSFAVSAKADDIQDGVSAAAAAASTQNNTSFAARNQDGKGSKNDLEMAQI